MFVYTIKWNRKTALAVVIIAAVLICAIIVAIGTAGKNRLSATVRNNTERIEFLQSLGWEVSEEAVSERLIIIPQDFSEIYSAYNDLQIAQGYDLSQFCGLEATVYTYTVLNYHGYDGNVVVDLYVLNYEVVGGDVHSLELDGFMHGLIRK